MTAQQSQHAENTTENHSCPSVVFDPEDVILEGVYPDQLSAYRAKRVWKETLGQCFLLDNDQDFLLSTHATGNGTEYILSCSFDTACARYAFWRLTNHQAPEAQYLIETAHIPRAESKHEEFLSAPDLKAREPHPEPAVLGSLLIETKAALKPVLAIQKLLGDFISRIGK